MKEGKRRGRKRKQGEGGRDAEPQPSERKILTKDGARVVGKIYSEPAS